MGLKLDKLVSQTLLTLAFQLYSQHKVLLHQIPNQRLLLHVGMWSLLEAGISWASRIQRLTDLLNGFLEQTIAIFGVDTDLTPLNPNSVHTAHNKELLYISHLQPMFTWRSMANGCLRSIFLIGIAIILYIFLQVCLDADVGISLNSTVLVSPILSLSLLPMNLVKTVKILWIARIHWTIITQTLVNVNAIILLINVVGHFTIRQLNVDVFARTPSNAQGTNSLIEILADASVIGRIVREGLYLINGLALAKNTEGVWMIMEFLLRVVALRPRSLIHSAMEEEKCYLDWSLQDTYHLNFLKIVGIIDQFSEDKFESDINY